MPGRVFGCILGHYSWTFDDPIFRIVFLRGLAWTAGCSFDRFAPLVTEGVKFQNGKEFSSTGPENLAFVPLAERK